MQKHTLKQFDIELENLNALIKSMFKISRKNIKHSLKAMLEGDIELAHLVIKHDDAVDALEVQADEVARNIIVQHQPAAEDLRFVFAGTKIVTDLERLSDMAVNIAGNVLVLDGVIPHNLASIPVMKEMVLEQLKSVRHSYLDNNAQQAKVIIEHNRLINEEFINTQRVMLTYMAEDPACISECVALTNIAKILERIGDHITNIAEMVIYSAMGYDVRHIPIEEIKVLLEGEDDDE